MKIMIEIEEDYYKIIQHDVEHGMDYNPYVLIANGTPLPEQTEKEPCEDCISRAETLRHGRLIYDDDGKGYVVVRVDEIIDLPSVTPSYKSIK